MIQKKEQIGTAIKDSAKVIQNNEINPEKNKLFLKITKYIIAPFIAGLVGFSSFFIILIGTEFLAYFLKNHDNFSVDQSDFILSSLGFICFFLISLIKNYHKE